MDEHRDIYTKPEAKGGDKLPLPVIEAAPENLAAKTRRRIIFNVVLMLLLLGGAVYYFYPREDKELISLIQLLRGPGAKPERPRVAPTNLPPMGGLGAAFDPGAEQRPPPGLPPQRMAEAMGHLRIATQFLSQNELQSAEDSARAALAIWPEMNAAQRLIGVVYIYRGQFDQAIAILERALQTDPFSAETMRNLAMAYLQKGQIERSEDLLLTALQIAPNAFPTHANLGLLYILAARYDEAAESLQTALDLMPENPSIRNNLGVALLRIGRYEEARAHFERLTRQNPDEPDAYFNTAIAYTLERRPEEAIEWLHEAVRRWPPQLAQRHLMDSDLNPLRSLPAFQALLRDITQPGAGLPPAAMP